jgi:hypothetical protein
MHVNKLNDKKYIGITCQKPNIRWQNGLGYLKQLENGKYKQDVFAKAILKYGWDNFEHKVLYENLSAEEAKAKEIELIAQYHTWIRDPRCHGYNMTPGGEGAIKYLDREEAHQAKLVSKRNTYEKRKLDQEKYAKDLESCRLANERRRLDPEKHEKRLISNRASLAKRALDPEKHAKDKEACRAAYYEQVELRKYLIDCYELHKELFTEEDYVLVFAKNKNRYVCNSLKQLRVLKTKIEELLNEKRNDNDYS